ncbi:DUF6221 family protein [Streptomyces sp. NPDC050844]|uniref:DUF6221 family protein n=1 Tax=Streptomyces sp. NPDC050844 TaxID=3155790 RepID=UPI0033CF9652
MEDLVQWYGEQLDEDEQVARGCSGMEWREHPKNWVSAPPLNRVAVVVHDGDRAHIVRHDPARVLRETAAKRQLLDDYTVTARIRDEAAERIKAAGDHPDSKDLETWDRAQREAAILEGPVKLAATPLADRPGYREEWRP